MARKELTRAEREAIHEMDFRENISVSETELDSGVYGINWPGKGTKTISETKRFIAQLKKAISLAKRINMRKN
tara:strand:- start:5451 stop:5669 length:219 start_codon:yes stop_codon:yes gene_type:complete